MTWLSDEDYHFIYTRAVRLCVDLIIRNDAGAVLLTQRTIPPKVGSWNLPGGGVRFNETLQTAANRIAQKELGVTIALGPLLGVCEMRGEVVYENETRHSISVVFEATIKTGTLTISDEASALTYATTIPAHIYPEHGEFLRSHGILNN